VLPPASPSNLSTPTPRAKPIPEQVLPITGVSAPAKSPRDPLPFQEHDDWADRVSLGVANDGRASQLQAALAKLNSVAEVAALAGASAYHSLSVEDELRFAIECQERGYHEEALAAAGRAIRLKPEDHRGFFARGIIEYRQRNPKQAIHDLTEAIRRAPTVSGPYYFRGRSYEFLGTDSAAISDFDRARALDPSENLAKLLRSVSASYLQRAGESIDRSDLDRAADYLDVAHRLNPSSADVLIVRAALRIERHEERRAFADLDRAAELHGNPTIVALLRIKAHRRLGQLESAHTMRERAIQADPASSLLLLIGGALDSADRSDWKQAQIYLDQLAAAFPNDTTATIIRGLVLGRSNGGGSTSLKSLERALARMSDSGVAQLVLGQLYLSHRNPGQALLCFDRAITLEPRCAAAFYDRGLVYLAQHEFSRAIDDFSESLNLLASTSAQPMSPVWVIASPHSPAAVFFHHHGAGQQPAEALGKTTASWQIPLFPSEVYSARALAYLSDGRATNAAADARSAWVNMHPAARSAIVSGLVDLSCGANIQAMLSLVRVQP
jgi:tetratricopeptide (TPR) repeat protein